MYPIGAAGLEQQELGAAPNNSMEPPPLRFAKHPEGRGSSTDPGQPGVWLWRDTSLGLAGRLPTGCSANLEAVRRHERLDVHSKVHRQRSLKPYICPRWRRNQPPSTALGDWYVDFIHTRNHRLVHFVSDRSFLSVVVPVRTLKTALDRHLASLCDLLEKLDVPPTIIQSEMDEMRQRAVARTQSPSVLALAGDIGLRARGILEQEPRASPLELSLQLGRASIGPPATAPPAEAAIALLLKRHSIAREGLRGA